MPKRLTVIVVVLMLIVCAGVLVPAINKVRDSAARVTCANNLKQLGIALWNYQDAYGSFPPGTLPNDRLPPERRFSLFLMLVPYIEAMSPLLLDRKQAWDAAANCPVYCSNEPKFPEDGRRRNDSEPKAVLLGPFRVLLCPANPEREHPGWPGFAHYVGIAGVGLNAPTFPKEVPTAGVFGYDRTTSRKNVRDSSATLLMMETASENGPWTAGGPPTVRGLDPARGYVGRGQQFGGTHPGGANALFVDGNVRLLADSMDPKVLEAMATIAGGEGGEAPQ